MEKEKILGQKSERTAPLTRQLTASADSDTLTFSVASEMPVERWWGKEVLSHDDGAVNLERLSGMVLLWDHGADPEIGRKPIGKVTNWEVKERRSYCTIRWSKSALGEQFRREVEEGIISNVSFGYTLDDVREINDTVLGTRWTPYEVSLVAMPADPTVGVGRSLSKCTIGETVEAEKAMETQEKQQQEQSQTAPPIQVNLDAERAAIREQESNRIRNIQALCKRHNLADMADKLIDSGASIEDARAQVLSQIEERGAKPLGGNVAPLNASLPSFGQRENQEFSLLRGIRSICPGFADYQKNCFEREVSEEIGRKIGRTTAGLFIPARNLSTRADIHQVATDSLGGYTVETQLLAQNFIEVLRNKIMAIQMGAQFLTGLSGFVDIPKQISKGATYWINENEVVPDTNITFGQISLSPKTIGTRMSVTRRLLEQSSLDVESLARNELVTAIAEAVDLALINGSGVGAEPKGILNYNINSITTGNNGEAPSYENLVALCAEIEADNADVSTLQWLTNTRVKSKLMLTPYQASGVEGNFIMKEGATTLLGYKMNISNQVPSDFAKGSGTALSAIILGAWNQIFIGEWGVLEILPNVYGKTYETGGVEIRALKTMDIQLRHEESFAALTDVITTI